ncbi:30S ribosomal protein S6 [Bacteroidota bacterium]
MSERRVYETTFIINAALDDNDVEAVITKVTSYIENHGGIIQEIDKWGRRRLAYPINKKYNGFYVHLIFATNSSTIPILERFMVLEDTILRHLTLILTTKLREFRIKRALDMKERIEKGIQEKEGFTKKVRDDKIGSTIGEEKKEAVGNE